MSCGRCYIHFMTFRGSFKNFFSLLFYFTLRYVMRIDLAVQAMFSLDNGRYFLVLVTLYTTANVVNFYVQRCCILLNK